MEWKRQTGPATGLAARMTARKRGRLFSYEQYVDMMNAGTEPPE